MRSSESKTTASSISARRTPRNSGAFATCPCKTVAKPPRPNSSARWERGCSAASSPITSAPTRWTSPSTRNSGRRRSGSAPWCSFIPILRTTSRCSPTTWRTASATRCPPPSPPQGSSSRAISSATRTSSSCSPTRAETSPGRSAASSTAGRRGQKPRCTRRIRPGYYFKNLYFDVITFNPSALKWMVEEVGADRVVCGTDYPYDMMQQRVVDFVEGAGLTEEAQEKILRETPAKIMKI